MILRLCYVTCVIANLQASFYSDHSRGWHWYELTSLDPLEPTSSEPEDLEPDASEPDIQNKKEKSPQTASSVVARYKKTLEEKLAKAWLHPTIDNIKAYQAMQKDMLDRSQLFSEVWMQSVFTHPELDHTLIAPTNHLARHIYLDQEKQRIKDLIRGLSEEYGLFFFFKSKCPYCHAFAPIVKTFSEEYRWNVLAISMDGSVCDTFPNSIADNGLARTWDVRVLPALFAVNPKTGHVIPVAYGMVSIDDIIERLKILVEKKGDR